MLGSLASALSACPSDTAEPCGTRSSFAAGAAVTALGIEAFEPVRTSTSGPIEVSLMKGTTSMGTLRLDTEEPGAPTALSARISLGGATVALRTDPWFEKDGDETPSAVDYHYDLGGRALSVRFEWDGSETPSSAVWSTPLTDAPAGAPGALRYDGRFVLRATDPSKVDTYLDATGLRSAYDANARRILDAALEDPAFWDAAFSARAACESASGLRPAQMADGGTQLVCAIAHDFCVDAFDFCDSSASRARGRRCAGRRAACHRAVDSCREAVSADSESAKICRATCPPCSQVVEVNVMSTSMDFGADFLLSCACGADKGCCAAHPCGCQGAGCSGNDPRFVTLDGGYFDYQGAGEYVLAQSDDGSLVVQTRTATASACGGFSTQRAIAIRAGQSTIRVSAEPRTVSVDAAAVADHQVKEVAGVRVKRIDPYVFVETDAGDVLTIVSVRSWLNAILLPSPARRGKLSGLLGNFNGSAEDDLADASGQGPVGEATRAYIDGAFGPSHRVTQATSLFEYGEGQSTATFTIPEFPLDRLDVRRLPAGARAQAEAACAHLTTPEIRRACIEDVACSGDDSAAGWYSDLDDTHVLPIDEAVQRFGSEGGESFVVENGPAGRPEDVGCSDGQREGLNDASTFPNIAACLGRWTTEASLRTPGAMSCGDDLGDCGVPGDLCAAGWHVCGSSGGAAELLALSADQCENAGGARYLTAISHCTAQVDCAYDHSANPSYPCFDEGWCSEAVCCGRACGSTGSCPDGLWAGRTRISGSSCGHPQGQRGGVLCCR